MGPIFGPDPDSNLGPNEFLQDERFAWILKLSDDDVGSPSEINEEIVKEDGRYTADLNTLEEKKNAKVDSTTNSPGLSSSGYGSNNEENDDKISSRSGVDLAVKKPLSRSLNVDADAFVPSNFAFSSSLGLGRNTRALCEDFPLNLSVPPPPASRATVAEDNTANRNTVVLWSTSKARGVGKCVPTNRHNSVAVDYSYSLLLPPKTYFAREEVVLFLVQELGSATVQNESLLYLKGSAVHSSGSVIPIEFQQNIMGIEGGIRCSFFPNFPGRYSIRISRPCLPPQTWNATTMSLLQTTPVGTKLVCPPIELNVCRNYSQEALQHSGAFFSLDPNEEKYWGITIDKFNDKMYVSDRSSNEILLVDPEVGKVVHRFGHRGNGHNNLGRLFRPTGLTIDNSNRRLVVADKDNHRISFFTVDGNYISSFGKKGHGPGEFNYPWDVDVSPTGDQIVVSDSRNHRIQFFDRYGNYQQRFSVFEEDPFEYKNLLDYPRGICFGRDGKHVFSSDFNTNNVLRLDLASSETAGESRLLVPQGKMTRPQGLTTDDMGNLIVCDSRRGCLRVLNQNGDLLNTLPSLGHSPLYVPVDVAFFRGEQLAIIDICGVIHIL